MISVTQALQIIQQEVNLLPAIQLPLLQAADKILAKDVFSELDIPSFPQSAMDGFAFLFEHKQKQMHVEGEAAAGNNAEKELSIGKAIRIFTGAPLPKRADTVVMQEKVQYENNIISLPDEGLQQGANVRPQGSEMKSGELALKAGTLLQPGTIGFLAGIGVAALWVIPQPIISIIVTGNELQTVGQPLQYGQVYESNSFALTAGLHSLRCKLHKLHKVYDDAILLTQTLQQALNESDLVLITGGVSVGKYDFVLEAAASCQVKTLFHKVKQRPGKPLFVGKKNEKLVVGLPGNPSSVLTCFYEYVTVILEQFTGKPFRLKTKQAILANDCKKAPQLTHFLKGFYDGEKVVVLDAQESYKLSSFAVANCLIKIDEQTATCSKGDAVEIMLLPTN